MIPVFWIPTMCGGTALLTVGYGSAVASHFAVLDVPTSTYWAMGSAAAAMSGAWAYGYLLRAHWTTPEIALSVLAGLTLPPLVMGLPMELIIVVALLGAVGLQVCGRMAEQQVVGNLLQHARLEAEHRKRLALAELYATIAREDADRTLTLFERNAEMWKLAQAAAEPLGELTESMGEPGQVPARPWLAELAIDAAEPISELIVRGERHWDGLAEVDVAACVEMARGVVEQVHPDLSLSANTTPGKNQARLLAPWGSGPASLAGCWVELALWLTERGAKSVAINAYPYGAGAKVTVSAELHVNDDDMRALDSRQWGREPSRTLLAMLPRNLQQVRCKLESSLWEIKTTRSDDGALLIETFVSIRTRSAHGRRPNTRLH